MSIALIVLAVIVILLILLLFATVKVAREYERGVIFRLGRLLPEPKGPGLFLLIPVIDRMEKVDLRTVTLNVPPQEVITKDNVPVRVNAVAYFRIVEPKAAIVQVENYMVATSQIAQTTLRSVLGQHVLDELLSERDKINQILQSIIDEATSPWGIKVSIVEVKDVEIPADMQRAMARQAEAERERRAKVISAEGEFQASERLKDAAAVMATAADHGAAPLPADAARDRRDEQLDDRLPDPDRVPRDARDRSVEGGVAARARRRRRRRAHPGDAGLRGDPRCPAARVARRHRRPRPHDRADGGRGPHRARSDHPRRRDRRGARGLSSYYLCRRRDMTRVPAVTIGCRCRGHVFNRLRRRRQPRRAYRRSRRCRATACVRHEAARPRGAPRGRSRGARPLERGVG